MSDVANLTEAIKKGDRASAKKLTQALIDASTAPGQILDALVMGMDDVGRRFKCNEVFVPEVLIAARAMKESMALLEPLLVKAGITPKFTAVIGTVQGDLHDIGKNLVAMMWKGANIGVVDLGTNVSPEKFIAAAREHNAQIIGLSALLTTTMAEQKDKDGKRISPGMAGTVRDIRAAGLTSVKIIIGGAPVTPEFARQIGADGFAPDAATAVDVARQLVA